MNDGSILAFIAILPFLGALVPGIMIRAGRNACASFTAVPTVLALLLLATQAPAVMRGEMVSTTIEWLPQLGLSASFFLDGLGLLFAGMTLGVGLLIILYARFYLSAKDPMGQFYTYLLLFQGAMLGIVISGNVLLLLIFWELTSLSSFLLIGFWRHKAEARQGARMALAITGGGGLLLIADFAPHDHEFLREAHQHRRLGFDDSEIVPWLRAGGLQLESNIALPPSTGEGLTVKIWTARRPLSLAAERTAA